MEIVMWSLFKIFLCSIPYLVRKLLALESLNMVLWLGRYAIIFSDCPKLIEFGSLVSSLRKPIKILLFCSHILQNYQYLSFKHKTISFSHLFIIFVAFLNDLLIAYFANVQEGCFSLPSVYCSFFLRLKGLFIVYFFSFFFFLSLFFRGSLCLVLWIVEKKICLFFLPKVIEHNQIACLEECFNCDQPRPHIWMFSIGDICRHMEICFRKISSTMEVIWLGL